MTPKEDAELLIYSFREYCIAWEFSNSPEEDETELSTKAALVAVNRILDILGQSEVYAFIDTKVIEHWEEVKSELISRIEL